MILIFDFRSYSTTNLLSRGYHPLPDLESGQCLPEPPDEPAELGRVAPLERRRVVELGVALGRRVRLQLADPPHPLLLAVQLVDEQGLSSV